MLKAKVVTPSEVVFDEVVERISIPTTSGVITVLDKHAALVTTIRSGELILTKEGSGIGFAVYKGVVNVRPHTKGLTEVSILLEHTEKSDLLDEEKAKEALARAEQLRKEKEGDEDFAYFESAVERELNRVSIARRYKSNRLRL